MLFCSHEANPASRALGTRVLYQLGSVSYIVYILQSPVWNLFHALEVKLSHTTAGAPSSRIAFAAFVSVLVGVALMVEQTVEKPAQRLLQRRWHLGRSSVSVALPVDPGSEAA